MKINVYVERLILEGLSMEARDGDLIRAAIEAELSRRLVQTGIPQRLATGDNRDRLLAPGPRWSSSPRAGVLGARIGAGVHDAITGSD